MCPDCGWPLENKNHDDVHDRMKRYDFTVEGVPFRAVLPWGDWSTEWQEWFKGLALAQLAVDACSKQRTIRINISNYSKTEEAIRWDAEIGLRR